MSKKASSMIPMPTSGGSVLPKLIGGAVLLALLVVVVKHPADAAHWAKAVIDAGGEVIDGLASFLRQVG
ncbi:hypothetical protein [Amycolatopsis sp. FDAARGOS 1241]|uniref:hypothetical protein n=1 Tax=Amycolatopsis sp. FDAARGOS 1241 TaxID=2778070 RepID=UPI00194E1586|nr:hypothetical protein [Amycolatopsis sp. FDAARGOS 1241]QRP47234.1 hypothetical protein I6J71_04285 [Amycolatopsis sp. FDAARGOS 1241]